MAKPVVFVVDDEATSLKALTDELQARYSGHYTVVSAGSAEEALERLGRLRADGVPVPVILADLWMPGMTGTELLARVRALHPTARRGLLISWGDGSSTKPILEAASLGQLDFYVPKPAWSPDELLHEEIKEGWLESWPITAPAIPTRLFVATSMQRPQTLATKVVLKIIAALFAEYRAAR